MKDLSTKKVILYITYTILLLFICINFDNVLIFASNTITIISPFVVAICIACIINILMVKIEPHLSLKLKQNTRRNLAIMLSFLFIFCFFATILIFLVPQITESVKLLKDVLPKYIKNTEEWVFEFAEKSNTSKDIWTYLINSIQDVWSFLSTYLLNTMPKIFNATMGFANRTINFFLGIVISIYLLSSKEKLIYGTKRLLKAVFPDKTCNYIIHAGDILNKTFSSFISGQITESLILGCLCTIGMFVLKIDYAILIGVIIGISSLIPIFGSILGTIPCVFILLVVNPKQAIIFLIFIIILQQVEGDFIYPRVVGKSIGISGFWVMFAMIIGGSLMGVAGLIIGLPVFATIYTLIHEWVDKRLKENQ